MKNLYHFISRRILPHHDNAFPRISFADTKNRLKNLVTKIPLLKNLIILLRFRSPKNKSKKILISGGYGYKNTGDEAQLAFNLDFLRKNYPDYSITVFTPDKEYTQQEHNVDTELAPRVVFFDSNTSIHYSKSDKKFKLGFFIKLPRLLINAKLLYAGLPMFFVSGKEARLLETVHESALLLLSGGGYLTGMTLSRLWDNMLLINIAYRMNVPVIASGQTIGVFKDNISPILAKWGLKKLHQITVRDKSASLNDLKSIGIDGAHISSTVDDALFCRCSSQDRISRLLTENNIPEEKPYITINAHYWGLDTDSASKLIKNIATLSEKLSDEGFSVVFLPMHPSDEKTAKEIIDKTTNKNIYLFKYDYDYRDIRGLIKNSVCCITMKHHPIVFACGEKTPVVSIVMDDYYEHKNKGALALFNLEDFLIRYSDNLVDDILQKVDYIIAHRDELERKISLYLDKYKPLAGKAIKDFFDNF